MIDKKSLKAINEWVESGGQLQERYVGGDRPLPWRNYPEVSGIWLDDEYEYRIKPKEPREFCVVIDGDERVIGGKVMAETGHIPAGAKYIKVREVIE